MVTSSTSSLSWAERAKKANDHIPSDPDLSPSKQKPVNVWNAKKAQVQPTATRPSSISSRPPQDPSTSASHTSPQIDSSIHGLTSTDNEDDAFVVRVPPNRDRKLVAVPTLDDSEAWPEVGKSSAIKSNKEKDDQPPGTVQKKTGEKKWIPLPAEEWQSTVEHRPRPHSNKNGQPTHPQSKPINGGANASAGQSRAQSGHNSVSQSRINSRSGSVQSSPRFPRNKRLPHDESALDNNPNPANVPPLGPSFHPQSDIQPFAESRPADSAVPMAYPTPLYSPDNTLAPYYSRHPPFPTHPPYRHPSAHSPSNASFRSGQDNTPPTYPPQMHYSSAAAPYPIYPTYVSYDYGMASPHPQFPYWNNPPHPGINEPHPSYPVAGGHYPNQTSILQPYPDDPSQNERSYLQQSTRIPPPPEQSQAVAGDVPAVPLDFDNRKSEAMKFGCDAQSPAPLSPCPLDQTMEDKLETVERAFTLFTIGMSKSEADSAYLQSRTRSAKIRSRTSTTTTMAELPTVEPRVIDLTDQETTWKFGFADGDSSDLLSPQPSDAPSGATLQAASVQTPLTGSDGDTDESDDFKVKDYGYGFGSGKNLAPSELSDNADHEREGGVDRSKGDHNRPRRGQFDRGAHGRRGSRGANGYPRYSRSYHSRGGSQSQRAPPAPQVPHGGPQSQFPPSILPMGEPLNGYYPQQAPPFMPNPYDTYAPPPPPAPLQLPPQVSMPPMPTPRSQLPFPLDLTRYWLLGQLEYYLSSQNLAQDFYLRQQMDAKGWIPITTLASFNRVKHLTHDYQMVKEVLYFSTVLMVKDDWVRMHGWESFVLPNAPASTVDYSGPAEQVGERAETRGEAEEEEEEEEDVVFVMGKEAGWSPQHRT